MSDLIPVISNDDKNIATLTHLGGILFSIFPALVVWILKKDSNNFVGEHAKEALNFQISIALWAFLSAILMWVLIGFFLAGIVWLANIVLSIIAAVKASKGEFYRYPLTLRLIN